ncbi:MAG: 4-hydroxy-3-methylbut-2-enyl diphosphate reductase [Salinivirgaceae bacterium]|nr:4-hydroxy-3-methylbut-2-enyl diphosphate reductase [Salinivirgaceae bacterium]MDD4745814.1 4-hydroxy-3-methylbut-2-enyl diphosphate reductase [Salinivirgaceae bacterium]MDY0281250.1 4-hydroxy-3-methylbut-2-enyl diphosphate reductase [Salinivirgaceae bacterium]
MIDVTIDSRSGFCFGVVTAVKKAEEFMTENHKTRLHCLGHIMHNAEEVKRLEKLGMTTINHTQIESMDPATIMIRAHGEPPETYDLIKNQNHKLIDATCPVVLKLQQRIRQAYLKHPDKQIVIFGKKGHAEVIGLEGQTDNTAIVISNNSEIPEIIDPNKEIILFSQTTMPLHAFLEIEKLLHGFSNKEIKSHNTICKRVINREKELSEFCKNFDVIVFISGKNSSNGQLLFQVCIQTNKNSHFISSINEINSDWFTDKCTVGVCGATSTPLWLMEQTAQAIKNIFD